MGALISTLDERKNEYESLIENTVYEFTDPVFRDLPNERQLELAFAKFASLPAGEADEYLIEEAAADEEYLSLMQQGRIAEAFDRFRSNLVDLEIRSPFGLGIQADLDEAARGLDEHRRAEAAAIRIGL